MDAMKLSWCVFAVIFCYLSCSVLAGMKDMNEDQIKVSEFEVKPGGEVNDAKQEWDGVTCTFTFAAQGGTHEKWMMGMIRSNDEAEYRCSVERPGGRSYLFFTQFKMEITGANLLEQEIHGEPGKPLQDHEYNIDYEKGSVADTASFQSQLSKLEVYAKRPKQEL